MATQTQKPVQEANDGTNGPWANIVYIFAMGSVLFGLGKVFLDGFGNFFHFLQTIISFHF